MAYTSAPETQTYSSPRIPLVADINLQAGELQIMTSACAGMVNVLPYKQEVDGQEVVYGETRYGIKANAVFSDSTAVCRGMHVWEISTGTAYYFVVVNDNVSSRVYTSTDTITWTAVNTLGNSGTTPVRFAEYIDDTNTKKLIMVDGIEGYVFDDNTAGTLISDVDFPTPHVPFPVFMNGRIFLAKTNTGDIYNCALNDPTSWAAGDFISSEVYPDDIQALVKIDNYILAIGKTGSEYFYDAANATGSPLARQEGASLPFGTQFVNSIAYSNNMVCFVSNNNDGEGVLRIVEGQKYAEVAGDAVMNMINYYLNRDLNGSTYNNLRAYFFRQKGNLFYTVTFNGTVATDTEASDCPTFVYSFATKMWSEFQAHYTNEALSGFVYPIAFSATGRAGAWFTYVAGQCKESVYFGVYTPDAVQDNFIRSGTTTSYEIGQTLRTNVQDFGTMNRKMMYRLGVDYLNSAPDPDVTYIPYVSWTLGSDYSSGWTGGRPVIASTAESDYDSSGFPFITQLGAFRRRAFLIYVKGRPRVWRWLEADINKGQQ